MQNKRITIVVPRSSGGAYTVSISREAGLLAAVGLGLMAVGLVAALALYGRVARTAADAERLAEENADLRRQAERVAELKMELDRLRTMEAKVMAIMGIDTLDVRRPWFGTDVRASAPDSISGSGFVWPASGAISRGYRPGGGNAHLGLDIAGRAGSPVVAAQDGLVAFAGVDSVFGNMVVLDHGKGLRTLYGHNAGLIVSRGESVRRGETIARLGSTGRSSAPHLHFEVHEGDSIVDPLKYLQMRK